MRKLNKLANGRGPIFGLLQLHSIKLTTKTDDRAKNHYLFQKLYHTILHQRSKSYFKPQY
jgi:hypothetical protein